MMLVSYIDVNKRIYNVNKYGQTLIEKKICITAFSQHFDKIEKECLCSSIVDLGKTFLTSRCIHIFFYFLKQFTIDVPHPFPLK